MTAALARVVLAAAVLLSGAACRRPSPDPDLASASWEEIERQARGQTVTWMMWQGDPGINAYVQHWAAPRLLERHGVKLQVVSGQGSLIVSALMTEKEARRTESAIDMMWINGETFYQLRQIGALYGPFTERLPNAKAIDFENPFIKYDFQQEVQGFECPWGNVQLALIYDTARVREPPRTRAALLAWVRQHPGRFTFDNAFTGMTLLKSWLIDIAGGPEALAGPFDATRYERHSAALWDYVRALRPYLWRKGETFPGSVAEMHKLFASGEIDFTMSNNDAEVDTKILQGVFPETARAFVFDSGTIQNTHYLGVVANAPHAAGAMVAIDFLISPEAQWEKLKPAVWGDGTVLATGRLAAPWPERFRDVPERRYAPPRAEIQAKALRELSPEYMIRLFEGFRAHVLAQ